MSGLPRSLDEEDAQGRFRRARDLLELSKTSLKEAHGLISELLPHVARARLRGQLNQQIWEAERAAGQHAGFFSQAGQDAYLDRVVFRGKQEGTFVEIGGYDGMTGSNCPFFEMKRKWSGLLIEPSPTFFAQAAEFRRATCLQIAVSDKDGTAEFMDVRQGFRQMSGLTETYDSELRKHVEADPRHQGHLIQVETRTLAGLLTEHGLTDIDYVSLDVEGGELSTLRSFPFNDFNIHAWTIENNTAGTDVPDLMQQNGYRRIEALGVDDVYVRSPTSA